MGAARLAATANAIRDLAGKKLLSIMDPPIVSQSGNEAGLLLIALSALHRMRPTYLSAGDDEPFWRPGF
jgi:hypothetical protein